MPRTDNVQINLNINGSRAISELNLLQSEAGKLREAMKGVRKGTAEYAKLDTDLKRVTKEMEAQQKQIGLNGLTIAQLTYLKNKLSGEIRKNLIPGTEEYIKKSAELASVKNRINQISNELQAMGNAQKIATGSLADLRQQYAGLEKVIDESEPNTTEWNGYVATLKKVKAQMDELETVVKGTDKDIVHATGSFNALKVQADIIEKELNAMTHGTQAFADKARQLQAVNAQLNRVRQDVQGVSTVWEQLKNRFTLSFDVGNLLTRGFDTLGASIKNAIGVAATLSDKIADVRKSTGMSTRDLEIFGNALQQLDTRTNVESLYDMAKVGGQFGIANKDLLAFVSTMDKIQVALGDELKGGTDEITKSLGGLRNIFTDIKTKNVGQDLLHIGNAINKLSEEGAATAGVMLDFATRIGGVGITMGLTSGQVLGISATMEELNINAERGSTAFTNILKEMAQAPDVFAQVAGKSSSEFKKLVNTNIYEAFKLVATGANSSSEQATVFAQVLKKLDVDGAGSSEVIAKLGSNIALMDTRVQSGSQSIKSSSSILNEFSVKNENLAANLEKLQKLVYNISLFFGTIFGNAFNSVSESIASFVGWLGKVPTVTTPAIEAARREKAELEVLVGAIKNNNTSNEARIELVKELQQKYPELSSKVGEFTDKTGKLTVNEQLLNQAVKDTNAEYDRRIFMMSRQEIDKQYQEGLTKSILKEAELRKSIQYQIKNFGEYTKYSRELASGASVEYNAPNKNLADAREAAKREVESRNKLLKEREETVKQLLDIAKQQGIDVSKLEQEQADGKQKRDGQSKELVVKSQKELDKAQHELAREAEQKRKEAREKDLEAQKAYEDLRVSLIQDSYDRELAEAKLQADRKKKAAEDDFAFIKQFGQFSKEELARKEQDHKALLEMIEAEHSGKVRQIEERRGADKVKAEQEARANYTAAFKETLDEVLAIEDENFAKTTAANEEKAANKKLQIAQQFEGEKADFWARVEALRVAEEEARAAELEAQRAHVLEKMEIMRAAGQEQSAEYKKLAAELLGIDVAKNEKELANKKQTLEHKKRLESESYELVRGGLQAAIELLDQDEEARKKHGAALKALKIADITVGVIKEVQSIWEYAEANPSNILIPGWANIYAGFKTGIAVARAASAISKISAQKYETGGVLKRIVTQYALGGTLRGDGVLPSKTTHAQGGLSVWDNRTGKMVAEFEGEEGVIFSKRAIKNNPHLWQPLLYSSRYLGGAPVHPEPRKYQTGGTVGGGASPTYAPVASGAQQAEDSSALMQKMGEVIDIIKQNAASFKKVYISLFELDQELNDLRQRRAMNKK